jgi:hypothetical protein
MVVGMIAVHEFITMDGVIEDPARSFDYPFDPRMVEAINGIMGGASKAILLGRRTYEGFAPTWSTRTAEEDPGAPFMNETPKYVVSASLQAADWNNTTILGPYMSGAVLRGSDAADGLSARRSGLGGEFDGAGVRRQVPRSASPRPFWPSTAAVR